MFMQITEENETFVTEFALSGCSGWSSWRIPVVTLWIIICSAALVGNGLIILVVISESRLHNPMYYWLCNLSIVDLCITVTVVPQSISNCLAERPVMSLPMCYTQMISGLFFGATECYLLVVMAYDRYVAISRPLHYILIMNRTVCVVLLAVVWTTSLILNTVLFVAMPHTFCENNVVDHFACEYKAVAKLLCGNISRFLNLMYGISIFVLVLPICFILLSYLCILVSILRMNSEGNRLKAFSTCGSHLAVVTMFFGTSIFSYLLPTKESSLGDKIITGLYAVLTPMLNPLIYTLRNKEILGALKRLFNKKR